MAVRKSLLPLYFPGADSQLLHLLTNVATAKLALIDRTAELDKFVAENFADNAMVVKWQEAMRGQSSFRRVLRLYSVDIADLRSGLFFCIHYFKIKKIFRQILGQQSGVLLFARLGHPLRTLVAGRPHGDMAMHDWPQRNRVMNRDGLHTRERWEGTNKGMLMEHETVTQRTTR